LPNGTGRLALGGVAPQPWRVAGAEQAMPDGAAAVSERLLAGAHPTADNGFKLTLAQRTIAAVMAQAPDQKG